MLDEFGIGIDPMPDNDTLRKPLVAVFPHPLHGRLVERVVLMVSHSSIIKVFAIALPGKTAASPTITRRPLEQETARHLTLPVSN